MFQTSYYQHSKQMESSIWFNRWAPSLAHTPQELGLLAFEHDPWLNRGQPKLKSSEVEAKGSIFDQPQVSFHHPYENQQGLSFDARRYKQGRRTDDSGMDRSHLFREGAPKRRTAITLEDDDIDFKMQLAREQLVQNWRKTRQQNIPKPQEYLPVNTQHQQESWMEGELMSPKRTYNSYKYPRLVAGTLHNPIFVDHNDTSSPMPSSVLLRSPSDFSRRSTSPYVASSSGSVEAVANSSNSVTHDQQHTLFDNFEAFSTVNDLEQNIRELSDFLGLPDDSRVETFDNNAGDLNDGFLQNLDFSDYILDEPLTENITVDCSNSRDDINQNQINIENNNASNQDELAHNNDNANNSSSAEFFPSCVGDELASLWGISCDP